MKPGEVVAGRFELVGVAGRGGMGIVYRACDRDGTPVAIKVLHTGKPAAEGRFLREMRVLAGLEHQGIVRYLTHGMTTDGELYLAMEWLEGENLRSRLRRGRLDVDEVLLLAHRAASALGAAHRRGIVHRDIKPANLVLVHGDLGALKVVDFGLAYMGRFERLTQTGAVLGTLGYMAPEQARGSGAVGPPTDVFALGCVLFECLAGLTPFDPNRPEQLFLAEAPRIEVSCPGVPAPLAALIASMLAKETGRRPPDGTAVVEMLAAFHEETEGRAIVRPMSRPALTGSEQRYVSVIAVCPGPACAIESERLTAAASSLASWESELPTVVPLGTAESLPTACSSMPPSGEEDTLPPSEAVRSFWLRLQVQSLLSSFGALVKPLGRGSFMALMLGQGVATDQVARAARCALALRGVLPNAQLALATGRCVLGGHLPLGEVLDRVVELLGLPAAAGEIRLDAIAAGLLGAGFEVVEDPGGPRLRGHRTGDRVRTLLGKQTSCVGRERELAMLAGLYEECLSESAARAVLITAPAGMGKSRLRCETLALLQARGEQPLVLMACGDPMQSGSPLILLRQILRQAADLEGVPKEQRYERLCSWLEERVARDRLEQMREFLGELAGVPPPTPGPLLMAAQRDPVLMGEQLRRAWSCWLQAECAARPVVLALEDLQWGDLPSVKLVDAALGALADRRLFVMGIGRPEVHELFPQLWADRALQELRLGPLTRKASEHLVRQVLGATAERSTVKMVVERAAGHAFCLEELIRAVAAGKTEALPETVLAMTQARLDTIDTEERRLLRAASIFGEHFTAPDLLALLGTDEQRAAMEVRLAELEQRELLVCDIQGGTRTCAFRHSLLRDGAYATLTAEDRRLGHLLAGEWLERNGEQDALLVAQHFEQGGKPERAVTWYLRAAQQAREANDYQAAIVRAERGLRCGATGETLGELQLVVGMAYMGCGEVAAAEVCCRQALELLPRGSQRWYEAASATVASETLHGLGAGIILEMVRFEPLGPITRPEAEMTGWALLVLWSLGLGEQIDQFVERLERRAHSLAPTDPAVGWLDFARAIRRHVVDDDAWSGMQLLRAAAATFERMGDLRARALTQWVLSRILFSLRDVTECERQARLALATAEQLGSRFIKGMAKISLGWALGVQGDVAAGRALLCEALAVDTSPSNAWSIGDIHVRLADVLLQAGQLEEAEREARTALEALVPASGAQVEALVLLGNVQLRGDCATTALVTVRKAIEVMKSMHLPSHLTWKTQDLLARALKGCGLFAGAKAAARRACDSLLMQASKFQDPAASQRLLLAFHTLIEQAERGLETKAEDAPFS
jgi:serine/threonine protein kinase/tetratricopeptide (TPR) repeat protein